MATKKFNTFEYASHLDQGSHDQGACIVQDVFETPHGYAIVVVSGIEQQGDDLCRTTFERVKYYLENEQEESSEVITKNALVYTSGYLYQLQKKDPSLKPGKLSCLCVLYNDEKINYSWVGDTELYLFTGKKIYVLAWRDHSKGDASPTEYLGQSAIMEPGTDEGPLSPVAGDKLIVATGELCKHLHTKDTRKILKDTMPLQTQASRILRQTAGKDGRPLAASIIMLSFHGISNTERGPAGMGIPVKAELTKHPKEQEMAKKKKIKKPAKASEARPGWKTALYIAGLLLVIYLLYDLVNYGPTPVQLSPATEAVHDTILQDSEAAKAVDEAKKAEAPVVIPGDETYVVRRGDTWGRIYTQFGVCSWFIINHPPNTGRFGSSGSLIAGESLRIPVKYSGKAELNPHYYQEFSMDVVGSRCENAGKELKEAFDKKLNP